jgi:predicted dehydrogenase
MKRTSNKFSRRQMLRGTAALGAGAWLAGRGIAKAVSPNQKLNIAIVGCAGRGGANLEGVKGENIVALCDVDEKRLGAAAAQFRGAKTYREFRKMLDAMHKQIDAVVVSTPDHTHALASLTAMRLGKHVYCEKPLAWSIEEARLMAAAARRYKVATQMGTQGLANDDSRTAIEVIRSGVLGEPRELHVWTDRATTWWPQGIDRPTERPPTPKNLDWDLWLGGAPARPYHPAYVPFVWRGWKDFGTGPIGDMGIHNAAVALHALRLGPPESVAIVETSGLKPETFPKWARLRCQFPARGGQKPLVLYWYDGGQKPPESLTGCKLAGNAAILVGSAGTLYSAEWTGGLWRLFPEEKFRGYKHPERTLPRAPRQDHYLEWLQACKGEGSAFCNFADFAAPLTEVMLVGALALRLGKDLRWDAEKMQADCPEAAPLVRREYRKGWEIH